MDSFFGGSGSNLFNSIVQVVNQATGTGDLDKLKSFFLQSLAPSGAENAAGVLFLLVMVCVIILLGQIRRNVSADNR